MSAPASVGVVVAVYGWAPFLAETLDGILDQRPAPARVVVVDDGSPEPLRLVAEHARRCELVRIEHVGLARARAAAAAQLGDVEWIALCDADDTWEPGSLAARLAALAAHPEAAVGFGSAVVVGTDGRPTGEAWVAPAAGVHTGAALRELLLAGNPIPVSSAIVRRTALEDAGGFASDLPAAEDWDLWLRLAARDATFLCVPEALVRYRRHPAALTADVSVLARASLAVHRTHAAGVAPERRRALEAGDLAALADGLVRDRRYREARRALAQSAALVPLSARQRLRRVALTLPGVRGRLGRRDPYRR